MSFAKKKHVPRQPKKTHFTHSKVQTLPALLEFLSFFSVSTASTRNHTQPARTRMAPLPPHASTAAPTRPQHGGRTAPGRTKAPWAVSTRYFSSSGVPEREAGAKNEVTCGSGFRCGLESRQFGVGATNGRGVEELERPTSSSSSNFCFQCLPLDQYKTSQKAEMLQKLEDPGIRVGRDEMPMEWVVETGDPCRQIYHMSTEYQPE